jgi:hypothetical protein
MTMKDRLEEVQSLPEVPAIAHFCSLFHTVLGLEEFDIAQLETALVSCQRPPKGKNGCQSGDGEFSFSNDDNSCAFLENLLVQLVRGCVPLHAKRINEDNYLTYTKQLFQAGLCIWICKFVPKSYARYFGGHFCDESSIDPRILPWNCGQLGTVKVGNFDLGR